MSDRDERREARRKRRIRNQIVSYLVLCIMLAAAAAGAYFGITAAQSAITAKRNAKEEMLQAALEESRAQETAEAESAVAELLELGETQQETETEEYTPQAALDEMVQIIAASVRNPIHVTDCALAGADIATVPYSVIEQMTKHPLTDQGIEKFQKDYIAVFGK